MKSFTTAFFSTTLLLSAASPALAQFGGSIFTRPAGECPGFNQEDNSVYLEYPGHGSVFCADITTVCPDGTCGLGVSATFYGVHQAGPTTFGACADSDCNDCVTAELTQTGTGFRYDCQQFEGQTHMLLMA